MKKLILLLIILLSINMVYSALNDNLVGYYKLENSTGTEEINGYTASTTGSPTYSAGKINNAVVTSNGNYLYVADNVDYDGTQKMSWSLWMNATTNDGNARALFSKRVSATSNEAYSCFLYTSGHLNCYFNNSAFFDTSFTPATNTWYHVVVVFDGSLGSGNIKLYVNGALNYSGNLATSIPATGSSLFIGTMNSDYAQYFQGKLDEFAIWNGKALNSSEITELYNGGSGLSYPFTTSNTTNITLNSPTNNTVYNTDSNAIINITYIDTGNVSGEVRFYFDEATGTTLVQTNTSIPNGTSVTYMTSLENAKSYKFNVCVNNSERPTPVCTGVNNINTTGTISVLPTNNTHYQQNASILFQANTTGNFMKYDKVMWHSFDNNMTTLNYFLNETFDSYTADSKLYGQNGWDGNDTDYINVTSNFDVKILDPGATSLRVTKAGSSDAGIYYNLSAKIKFDITNTLINYSDFLSIGGSTYEPSNRQITLGCEIDGDLTIWDGASIVLVKSGGCIVDSWKQVDIIINQTSNKADVWYDGSKVISQNSFSYTTDITTQYVQLIADYRPGTDWSAYIDNITLTDYLISKDSSENEFNGIIIGAITKQSGKVGEAYDFNGSNTSLTYVNIPHNESQLLTTGGTINAWVYPKGNNVGSFTQRIVDKSSAYNGLDGYSLYIRTTDRTAIFNINGTAEATALISSSNALPLNTWTMITVTWNSTGYSKLYINRTLNSQIQLASPSGIITTNNLRIGNRANSGDRPFNGTIDEVAIYNRTLNNEEIESLYNNEAGSGYDNLSIKGELYLNGILNQTKRFGGEQPYSFDEINFTNRYVKDYNYSIKMTQGVNDDMSEVYYFSQGAKVYWEADFENLTETNFANYFLGNISGQDEWTGTSDGNLSIINDGGNQKFQIWSDATSTTSNVRLINTESAEMVNVQFLFNNTGSASSLDKLFLYIEDSTGSDIVRFMCDDSERLRINNGTGTLFLAGAGSCKNHVEVPIKVLINTSSETFDAYYNDTLVFSGLQKASSFTTVGRISAIVSDRGNTQVIIDDVCVSDSEEVCFLTFESLLVSPVDNAVYDGSQNITFQAEANVFDEGSILEGYLYINGVLNQSKNFSVVWSNPLSFDSVEFLKSDDDLYYNWSVEFVQGVNSAVSETWDFTINATTHVILDIPANNMIYYNRTNPINFSFNHSGFNTSKNATGKLYLDGVLNQTKNFTGSSIDLPITQEALKTDSYTLALWSFNETVGNYDDQSSNNNDILTDGNQTRSATGGKFGGYVITGKETDRQMNFTSISLTGSSSWTIEGWINATVDNQRGVALSTMGNTYLYVDNTGEIGIFCNGGDLTLEGSTDIEGDWHHFAITNNASDNNVSIIIDGVLDGSKIDASFNCAFNGWGYSADIFNGDDAYDDFRISNNTIRTWSDENCTGLNTELTEANGYCYEGSMSNHLQPTLYFNEMNITQNGLQHSKNWTVSLEQDSNIANETTNRIITLRPKLACFGDSITKDSILETADLWCTKLNNTGIAENNNQGQSGKTSQNLLDSYMDTVLLKDNYLFMLMIGTNDLLTPRTNQSYYDNLVNITNQMLADGIEEQYFMLSDIPNCNQTVPDRHCALALDYQKVVKRVSYDLGISYCNVYDDVFGDGVFNSDLFRDEDLHPSASTHSTMNSTYYDCWNNRTVFNCTANPLECWDFSSSTCDTFTTDGILDCSENCTFTGVEQVSVNVSISNNGTITFSENGLWNMTADHGYIRGVDNGDVCSIVFNNTWLRTN